MDAPNRAKRRSQMGLALREWASGPGARHEVGPGAWMVLTGAPSADVNLALVHDADPQVLACTVEAVVGGGCPALLMFAGHGRAVASGLGSGWSKVGAMPFMAITANAARRDARVRRAGVDDVSTVIGLLSEAFVMAPQVAAVAVTAIDDPDAVLRTWLLEDDGQAVSTVTTGRVDDAVTVWCMATPERFARRGYGRALLAEVMAGAAQEGARVGLLAATPAGKPLYDAAGWQTIEEWDLYAQAGHRRVSLTPEEP